MKPPIRTSSSTEAWPGSSAWSRDLVAAARPGRGAAGLTRWSPIQGPPESLIDAEMAQGGFGAVVLARNHLELWRERFLYRQRAKAVSLIGTHPRWSQVLVRSGPRSGQPVRPASPRADRSWPSRSFNWIFCMSSRARRRSPGAQTMARDPQDPRMAAPGAAAHRCRATGDVAATILRELRHGDFGTLVMGKRGLSRIKQFLLGSVSSAVLQGLTQPDPPPHRLMATKAQSRRCASPCAHCGVREVRLVRRSSRA
ncbi:MAG: universal stress protein [Desulfobacterales bacterium]|nr:universal stress protein [Desulfobacterales bacterium]